MKATYYRHDEDTGKITEFYKPMTRALLSQGETIDALIDRAIERLPEDARGFVLEAAVTPGVLTVAVGFKTKNDWTVTLGGDFRKEGSPQGTVRVTKTW